jgi:hypothetical protein
MGRRHSFVLQLCPIPNLDVMLALYRGNLCCIWEDNNDCNDNNGGGSTSTTATSQAVLAHAWLKAHLMDAFASPSHHPDNGGGKNNSGENKVGHCPG